MMDPEKTRGDSFVQVLRAEWAAFCQGRLFLTGMGAAALLTMLLGLSYAAVGVGNDHASMGCGGNTVCSSSSGPNGEAVGPNGETVEDKFYFVYQPLVGNGSITARLTSITGEFAYLPPNANPNVPSIILKPGVEPWAKAGVIIKASTKQGSPYAAMMTTGSYGVHMQYNFTHDIAGLSGRVSAQSPRWLRLTRSGDILTGYESTDGTQWTRVGAAQLAGLSSTVQIGLFVNSPCDLTVSENGSSCRFAQATAVFDHVSLQGETPQDAWSRDDVGVLMVNGKPHHPGSLVESSSTFTVTGNGDIAPLGTIDSPRGSQSISRTVIGTAVGLIVVIIVAVLFVTAEQSPGRIRISKRTSLERTRVLAAQAAVIGPVTFASQLIAVVIAVQLGKRIMLSKGNVLSVTPLTEWRVMVGTAALVAVAAIFALALGALLRRRIVAVTAGLALMVVPFILAFANLVPDAVSQWLLRLTPAAGFAIQQSTPAYSQVNSVPTLQAGYYPLAPWVGFAVLCGYAVLALGLAVFVSRRRDA